MLRAIKFAKRILIIVYILLLILLLIFGIYYADLKTRSIGFEDALPVLYCDVSEDNLFIHFMDKSVNLNIKDNFIFEAVESVNKNSVPYRIKVVEALNGITKKIIDWFVRVCGL